MALRLLSALALASALLATALPAIAAASGETIVALGDSYSSGEGNKPFDEGTDEKDVNMCHRSDGAWPRLIGTPIERHLACSGATTEHFDTGKWSDSPDDRGQLAQLSDIASATPVDVVTVTMGGNDLGFEAILTLCRLRDCASSDNSMRGGTLDLALGFLRAELEKRYREIQAASRGARLIVVGYPEIVPDGSERDNCRWLSEGERRYGADLTRKLNTALSNAATASGATYVPTLDALDGHELCTGKSWVYPIISLTNPAGVLNRQLQGHPTKLGQEAIASRVRRAIQSAPPGCATASSVSAILDDSGSMEDSDPQTIRARAVELLLSKPSAQGRTVGAVEFGEYAATLFSPGLVSAELAQMVGALGLLQNDGSGSEDSGSTNYNAAFARSSGDQPSPGARIFLTDGAHNEGDYEEGHSGGPPTYVIGLNIGPAGTGDEDGDRLDRIARETGGRYFPLRRLAEDDVETQLARLQPVVNEIDNLLSCRGIHDQASIPFSSTGEVARSVRTDFGGESALEAVVSWTDPGTDVDLVAATARDRNGKIIADLEGKRKIARSKKRRRKLTVNVVEGQTFDTVTVQRPKGGKVLALQFQATALGQPVTAEVQISPVPGGGAPAGTAPVPVGPAPTPAQPAPQNPPPQQQQPQPSPPSPPRVIVTVDNRVTNGGAMREDSTPARLTTKPWTFCTSRGCNINGTERSTGQTYDAAVCQTEGERTTNGNDHSAADDANPERFESTRYYGVRLPDGTFGFISEVWIRASDRGGLGLPGC
jgi:lysophospholipase L1-like esterase